MKCEGHSISITDTETTVIRIDANPDASAQHKARDDPGVAAILKSLGISKVEDYVYQDNKKVEKLVSYVMTVSNAGRAKYLIKKVAQILPEFIDDDDKKVIDNTIDDIMMPEREKRLSSSYIYWPTENENLPTEVTDEPKTKKTREIRLTINLIFVRFTIRWKRERISN